MRGEGKRVIRVVEKKIGRDEVMDELKKMKGDKAEGLDGNVAENLIGGDASVVDWFLRIFNRCTKIGVVPEDRSMLYTIPLHKGELEVMKYKRSRSVV